MSKILYPVFLLVLVAALGNLSSAFYDPDYEDDDNGGVFITTPVQREPQDFIEDPDYDRLDLYLNRKTKLTTSLDDIIKGMRKYSSKRFNLALSKIDLEHYPLKKMRQVISLYEMAMKPKCNDDELSELKKEELALDNAVRQKGGNHRSTRIDRVLSLIAHKYASNCLDFIVEKKPEFPLLFVQRAYASLEKELETSLKSSTRTIDDIASKLDEIKSKEVRNSGRVYYRAVIQLSSLEIVAKDSYYCGETGFEVVLKNYLATGYHSPEDSNEQTSMIHRYVGARIQQYASTCRGYFPEKFKQSISKLSESKRKNLVAMTSELYLDHHGKRLNDANVDFPLTGGFFQTPELVAALTEWARSRDEKVVDFAPITEWRYMSGFFLFNWLKWVAKNDPDYKWLLHESPWQVKYHEQHADYDERLEHINGLLDRNVLAPCRAYTNLVGPGIFEQMESKIVNLGKKFTVMDKEDFLHDLDFVIGRKTFVACREILNQASGWAPSIAKFVLEANQ